MCLIKLMVPHQGRPMGYNLNFVVHGVSLDAQWVQGSSLAGCSEGNGKGILGVQ